MAAVAAGAPGAALATWLAALARAFARRIGLARSAKVRFAIAAPASRLAHMLAVTDRLLGRLRRLAGFDAFGAGNALADQLFDRRHRLEVERADDGDRGAGASGAAGTADAVDIVVGMVRHVEIEHVAGGRDIQAARGDVGGDQQRNFTLAELVQRGGACG